MTYRIGITGAQGTGKSTLAGLVCSLLRDAGVTDVLSWVGLGEQLRGAGLVVGDRADADALRRFARAHLEREAQAHGGVHVYDRCLLDALAYADALGSLRAEEFEALTRNAVQSAQQFDQLIWLRVTNDYPAVDAADETPAFRRTIDAAIGSLATAHSIHLVECSAPLASLPELAQLIVDQVSRSGYGTSAIC